jgi:preprotein translocase subunit SecY
MFNMFSGGALSRFTVFALGIMPYISASIIMQLLHRSWCPQLEALKKEGEAGRRKITQYTRYGTLCAGDVPGAAASPMALECAAGPGASTPASVPLHRHRDAGRPARCS